MGAFGMSDVGKVAKGQMYEMPLWAQGQFKDYAGMAKGANPYQQWINDYYMQQMPGMMDQGIGGPGEVWDTGRQISPYTDEITGNITGRAGQVSDMYGDVASSGAVKTGMDDRTNTMAQFIQGANAQQQGGIRDVYGDLARYNDTLNNQITGSIGNSIGAARDWTNPLYGNMYDETNKTYGDLTAGGDRTFGEMRGNVEKTAPGGEFDAASTARAYGPMMRATMNRLRASGVDPNSLEGISALRGVEAERARGMDDKMSSSLSNYAKNMNDVLYGKQSMNERLGTGRLTTGLGLAKEQSAINRDLSLTEGSEFRNQLATQQNRQQTLELSRLQELMGQADTEYGRNVDWLGRQDNVGMAGREMDIQDWQNKGTALEGMNDADVFKLNAMNTQFGQGQNFRTDALNTKGDLMTQATNFGQQGFNNQMAADQAARGWYNTADQGFQNTYENEAKNAGWLTKGLVGAGIGLAGAIPGVGPYIQAAGTGFMNGTGGNYSQSAGYNPNQYQGNNFSGQGWNSAPLQGSYYQQNYGNPSTQLQKAKTTLFGNPFQKYAS